MAINDWHNINTDRYEEYPKDTWAEAYRNINAARPVKGTLVTELPKGQNLGKLEDGILGAVGANGGAEMRVYVDPNFKQIDYKYEEDRLLGELRAYIDSTYNQHYSKNQFQATEFIIDGGHGTGFCMGNVMKYAQRYGRKGSPEDWRKDLLKVIHYAIIQLHVHDKENKEKK